MLPRRGLLIVLSLMLFLALRVQASASGEGVTHYKTVAAGVHVHVVRVVLDDPTIRVKPILAPVVNDWNGRAPFNAFIKRHQPLAAINGTFFDTRTYRVTGNVIVDGRLVREGYIGNAVAFRWNNAPELIRNTRTLGRYTDWSRYGAAVGGGPTLVVDGKLAVNPRAEGFRDPGLFRLARRSAIGFNGSVLILVMAPDPISLTQLARAMRSLGAANALSLDGGSSSALYYKGKFLSRPGRQLTNVLGIFSTQPATGSAGSMAKDEIKP